MPAQNAGEAVFAYVPCSQQVHANGAKLTHRTWMAPK